MPPDAHAFLAVIAVALLAPMLAGLVPRLSPPILVLEIILGIVVGPHGLGWVQMNERLEIVARFGMLFLFFLAGLEIDFQTIRGRPLRWAIFGWLLSVMIAIVLGWALESGGYVISHTVMTLALTTTALGALLPILRDADALRTPFGSFVMAAGAVGEFGPIVLISATLAVGGESGHATGLNSILLMVGLTAATVIAAYLALRLRPRFIGRLLKEKMHTSAQLPVRLSVLLLALLIIVVGQAGLDLVLGAIAAGIIVGLFCQGEDGKVVRYKLEAIGFGFFVPIFFVTTGIKFDLQALIGSTTVMLRVPLLLLLFLIVRGLPVFLCRHDLPRGDWFPLALMSATALPLVVAITEIAVETNQMRPENATALVGAGMVSVLIFPMLALYLRSRAEITK